MACGTLRATLRALRLPTFPAAWSCLRLTAVAQLPLSLFEAPAPPRLPTNRWPLEPASFQAAVVSSAVEAVSPAAYHVEVVTGDVRGAGTQTGAVLKLIGTVGESEEFVLGNDAEDPGFERGSSREYVLETDRQLGELLRVNVQQMEPSWAEVGSGWFLERIDISGPGHQKLSFPCSTWIGKSDGGDYDGGSQRNLIPCQQIDTHGLIQAHYLTEPLKVRAGAVAWPHPEKVAAGKAVNKKDFGWAGEDAYFHAQCRHTGIFGIGVADGVYMWRKSGIDAGALARKLTSTCQEVIDRGAVDVLSVLQQAADRASQDGCKGSSTCCVILIDTLLGRLTSANLGDSGYLVLGRTPHQRDFHLKYRSPQQEHNFGVPYQLGHEEHADRASDAMLMTLPVMPGDVIIVGSDGLWDNLSGEAVFRRVQAAINRGTRAPAIALELARAAFEASINRDGETPYSLAATEAFDMVYSGGKQDDITVLAACLN